MLVALDTNFEVLFEHFCLYPLKEPSITATNTIHMYPALILRFKRPKYGCGVIEPE